MCESFDGVVESIDVTEPADATIGAKDIDWSAPQTRMEIREGEESWARETETEAKAQAEAKASASRWRKGEK